MNRIKFKFTGFIVLSLILIVSMAACDNGELGDTTPDTYNAEIVIEGVANEDHAEFFSVLKNGESGIDQFRYEDDILTGDITGLSGTTEITLVIDDNLEDGEYKIENEVLEVDKDNNEAKFEVEFDEKEFDNDITGEGTENNPFIIYTFNGLEKVGKSSDYPLDAHYKLGTNIDAELSENIDYNDGKGWEPIGDKEESFKGYFDGQNYKIEGLYINRSSQSKVGLFGVFGDGVIKNIDLVNFEIVGENYTGSIIGKYEGGVISNLYAKGEVVGNDKVGGIIGGINPDFIEEETDYEFLDLIAEGNVVGENKVGGLIGEIAFEGSGRIVKDMKLSNSSAEGNVQGENLVGGLIGYSHTDRSERDIFINRTSAKGDVEGNEFLGGLIGKSTNTEIKKSFSTGDVTGFGNNVGGLIGENDRDLIEVYTEGSVSSQGDFVGGIIGKQSGRFSKIQELNAKGEVIGNDKVGGIIGGINPDFIDREEDYELLNLIAEGDVVGENEVGGLIGEIAFEGSGRIVKDMKLSNSSAEGNVQGENLVGGLIGYSHTDRSERTILINRTSAKGDIEGNEFLGGLIGKSTNTEIKESFSTGDVTGFGNNVGGLIGENDGELSRSYSKGDIVSQNKNVGGLIGKNTTGNLSEVYATGDVNGNDFVGGLIGFNDGNIEYSYSVGKVLGELNIGGLIGYNDKGEVLESFWNIETSGQANSDGGESLKTSDMVLEASFSTWNFVTAWEIEEEVSYPYFQWQDDNIPTPE